MTGNVPIVRLLVKLPGLDVNLADNEGNTALHLASQAGKIHFLKNCSFHLFLTNIISFRSR
jgi:ankyrin repeat protein